MEPIIPADVITGLLSKTPELLALGWIVTQFLAAQKNRDALFVETLKQLAEQGRALTHTTRDALERNTSALASFTARTAHPNTHNID